MHGGDGSVDYDVWHRCLAQFNASLTTNMTDAISSLQLISSVSKLYHHTVTVESNLRGRQDEVANDFLSAWSSEPLVLDKWFVAMACADVPDGVERVQSLREHPEFSLTNPNRARSLFGAFAVGCVMACSAQRYLCIK